jgi:hypothetical protein
MSVSFKIIGIEKIEKELIGMITKYSQGKTRTVVSPFSKKVKEIKDDQETEQSKDSERKEKFTGY